MNLVYKIIIIFLALIPLAAAEDSEPVKPKNDNWFARDKIEHFSYSLFCTAATTKVANRHFEIRKEKSIALGVSVSFSLGLLKEGIDFQTKKGTSSMKDIVWDLAGTLTGAFIAHLTL